MAFITELKEEHVELIDERIVQFLFAIGMLLIDQLIDRGQGPWTCWPEPHYRGASISGPLIGDYANHVWRAIVSGKRSARALRAIVINRWDCPAEYNEGKPPADVTLVSRYVLDTNIGRPVVSGAAGKGSMKPRTVDSTIPLIPRSSAALSSTWNLINAARALTLASMSATLAH